MPIALVEARATVLWSDGDVYGEVTVLLAPVPRGTSALMDARDQVF